MTGKRIKQLRKEKKISQEKLANTLNVTTSAVGMYEIEARQPSNEIIQKIAEFFNVTVDYLLGRNENLSKTPILGIVRAGEPILANENIIGYEYLPENECPSGECYFLKVIGDSMNMSNIKENDLVLIRKQEEIENGEIGVILVDGEEATIKKFYKNENMVTLMPHSSNSEHQPRMVDINKIPVKILGKVMLVKSITKFE
jgi:repressor LexA